jgi:hypothetical protein
MAAGRAPGDAAARAGGGGMNGEELVLTASSSLPPSSSSARAATAAAPLAVDDDLSFDPNPNRSSSGDGGGGSHLSSSLVMLSLGAGTLPPPPHTLRTVVRPRDPAAFRSAFTSPDRDSAAVAGALGPEGFVPAGGRHAVTPASGEGLSSSRSGSRSPTRDPPSHSPSHSQSSNLQPHAQSQARARSPSRLQAIVQPSTRVPAAANFMEKDEFACATAAELRRGLLVASARVVFAPELAERARAGDRLYLEARARQDVLRAVQRKVRCGRHRQPLPREGAYVNVRVHVCTSVDIHLLCAGMSSGVQAVHTPRLLDVSNNDIHCAANRT